MKHPNKGKGFSLAELIAQHIRQYGYDRTDRRELELAINRPLTKLERKAFCMAADGLNQKTDERGKPIPYDSIIARNLPTRYQSNGTLERRYTAIRDAGRLRIRRSRSGRYRLQGEIERGLDLISDQGATPTLSRDHDTGTKYPEANYDEPPVDRTDPHRWYERPYMDTKITRSAVGSRYRAESGTSERLQKLKGALRDPVIGQSRYDGHRMPVTRPPAAEEVSNALNDFLKRGGQIETVPAGMTGKRYMERLAASETV